VVCRRSKSPEFQSPPSSELEGCNGFNLIVTFFI
jgi:hypothetical protein